MPTRLPTRIARLEGRFPEPSPGYVAVVRLPDGREYLARGGIPRLQVCPRGADPRENWRPPFRRFRPGVDDRDRSGRPIRVEVIEVEYLSDVRVSYRSDGPFVEDVSWMNRDTRFPIKCYPGAETETEGGFPLSLD